MAKKSIETFYYDSFYPENNYPYTKIRTRLELYKITNGESIGAYGDLYVIQQNDYSIDGELVGLTMVQSYDSMKMYKYYEQVCNNCEVIDLEFI